MKARILLESAALGPDELHIARQAFDAAWQDLAPRYRTDAVEGAREQLAKIALSLLPDTKDPGEILAIAVQEMTKG